MSIKSWFVGFVGIKTRIKTGDTIVHKEFGECVVIGGALNVRQVKAARGRPTERARNVAANGSGFSISLEDFVDAS